MLALLIQSIYNIVDSFFVAKYSAVGLTALSIIYPIQLLMVALATGTGAGVNILISRLDGLGRSKEQHQVIKSGLLLTLFHFLIFAVAGTMLAEFYFQISTDNLAVAPASKSRLLIQLPLNPVFPVIKIFFPLKKFQSILTILSPRKTMG